MITKAEFDRAANRAIAETIAENTRLGLPNVYSINGKVFFQLPNGDIVMNYDWSQHEQFRDWKKKEINNKTKK